MVAYVAGNNALGHIFDPAVGAGVFFRAAKATAHNTSESPELFGTEIDPGVLVQAQQTGLTVADLANVTITDFVLNPPKRKFKAIVANPPYIRHHRLSPTMKKTLRALSEKVLGTTIDSRAGLHVYFLIRALTLLDIDGRLSFIMPADTCEGIFAPVLWEWITKHYRLDAVVTFTPDATPFPKVDTNPIIFMIRNASPETHFVWAQCIKPRTMELKAWISRGLKTPSGSTSLQAFRREITEGLATGLSRPPTSSHSPKKTLADFARVMRGIATGANSFFLLTRKQAAALGIPNQFLVAAIGRTRDAPGNKLTHETMIQLEKRDRPTLLLMLDKRPADQFPATVREYLKKGEKLKLNRRPTLATRKPWYRMDQRTIPPILFAYLGRRNVRFVRNYAQALPLTGFLGVYPHSTDPVFVEKLWTILRDPETIANLKQVGKSYGRGCIKVEPHALEKLPLPDRDVFQGPNSL